MKYLRVLCVLSLFSFLLVSCSSVAHVERDNSVNFSRYHTFAWTNTQSDTVKTKLSDLTERNLKFAVNEELQKQGWKEDDKRPDILLTYDVAVDRVTQETNNPVYSQPTSRYYYNPYSRRWMSVYYPSEFLGYDRQQREVREGTMTIRMIDAKSDKTVWQGWTTDQVDSRNLTNREIQSSVRSIFRKFDVANR